VKEKLGIGLVGLGWVSSQYIRGFRSNRFSEIRAACVRDSSRGRSLLEQAGLGGCRVYDNLGEMLAREELEIICILTPNHLHASQAIQCAEAGKHLIIEKPAALNWGESLLLEKRLRVSGVKNMLGFVLRWNSLFKTIREILRRQMLGRVFHIEVDYMFHLSRSLRCFEWCARKDRGGSVLMQSGCHAVDGLCLFAGKPVEEVVAYCSANRKEFDHPTTYTFLMRFQDGATGKLFCTYDTVHPYIYDIQIYGEKGSIRKDMLYCPDVFPGQTGWVQIPSILPDTENVEHHPFPEMIDYFVDCVRSGVAASPSLQDSMQVFEIIEAAERSAALGGRPVRLPLEAGGGT
jgi:predicted dehydrogenase